MSSEGPYVSQAEFARMLGMHRGSVTRFKQAGRLVFDARGRVDVDASLRRLEQTRDPNRDDVAARHAESRQVEMPTQDPPPATEVGDQYQASRARKEAAHAALAQIEHARAAAKLVHREDIEHEFAGLVTRIRQTLEHCAHRLAPGLVRQDLDVIRAALRVDTVEALTELEREIGQQLAEVSETRHIEDPPPVTDAVATYHESLARKVDAQAALAEIDLARAAGRQVNRESVAHAIDDALTRLRQALENRPHRLAPELVAQDLDGIRSALRVDTVAALTESERSFSSQIAEIVEDGQ